MITKVGSDYLEKVALLGAWKKVPSALRAATGKIAPVYRGVRTVGSAGAKPIGYAVDKFGRGLNAGGKFLVNHPGTAIPLLAAGTVGAWHFGNKRPAYDAHIESMGSGPTKRAPFTGAITFSDPSFRQYYE